MTKLFISASSDVLTLAERLQDALKSDHCEATVWSERDRRQSGDQAVEILEAHAGEFDFAVVLLSKRDLTALSRTSEATRSRDNCIFEAGLFAGVNGKDRCILVHSVTREELPANLADVDSVSFDEPPDLSNEAACVQAMAPVAAALHARVRNKGRSTFHARIPLSSISDLFKLERPTNEGGHLRDCANVVVCDTQPMAGVEPALQVRRNMDRQVSYHYFLYLTDDCIDKTCQALQTMAVAGVGHPDVVIDFNSRVNVVKEKRAEVVSDLRSLCVYRRLRITFLLEEPQFCFRAHNASDENVARVYARYYEHGYLLWAQGRNAVSLWAGIPRYLDDSVTDRIFVPLKAFSMHGKEWRSFEMLLDRAHARYFPQVESDVKGILIGHTTT